MAGAIARKGKTMKSFDLSTIRETMQPIESEYRADVRTIAEEAIAEYPLGPDDNEWQIDEKRREYIAQSVDTSWWVIYTMAAQAVLMISANDDAFVDIGVDAVSDDTINWSLLAFCAMEADVLEHLATLTR